MKSSPGESSGGVGLGKELQFADNPMGPSGRVLGSNRPQIERAGTSKFAQATSPVLLEFKDNITESGDALVPNPLTRASMSVNPTATVLDSNRAPAPPSLPPPENPPPPPSGPAAVPP